MQQECQQSRLNLPPAQAHAMAAPQKLDLYLEGLSAFQEGACALKAGDALGLQQQEGRLACVTQSGTVVGLVPADKRGLLSRGPWSGTVRSVKRHAPATAATAAAAGQDIVRAADGAETQAAAAPQTTAQQHQAAEAEPLQQQAAASSSGEAEQPAQAPSLPVLQLLVRFTPEEQRWQQRQQLGEGQQQMEEDAAKLSTEQFEMLGTCCCHPCS